MELTPGQVKNLMKRGLRRLIDAEPDAMAKLRVWKHFENQCAYCGICLEPGKGDIDHLISAALGGANGLANRVLSCKPCNAHEKREQHWERFLKTKCSDPTVLQAREQRIRDWVDQNGGRPQLDQQLSGLLETECNRATEEYEISCQRIRAFRSASSRQV